VFGNYLIGLRAGQPDQALASAARQRLQGTARRGRHRQDHRREDRNSHTDLWDFQANVEGSKAAIASLRPVLAERDPALVSLIGRRFEEVETELAKHAKATASSSTSS
jgi:hypothetical protein